MGLGRYIIWLLAFFAISGGFAADVQTFVISQAHPQLPVMTAYLDILDASGQPVAGLGPADFSAVVGAISTKVVDFKPFRDTGEGVAYVFLVDISKSIGTAQFSEMRAAIETWISGLKPADSAAICTFGEDYRLLTEFTTDKQKLTAALNSLAPSDLLTKLYLAIDRAVELEQRIDPGLPIRRVIVVLTDGKDEGSALAPEDVFRKVRASHLPIYSIGVSRLPAAEKQRYLDVLHRFSNISGGLYEEAGGRSVTQLYAAIQQAILRIFVVHLACAGCSADGRRYPLEITLTQGTRGLKAVPLNIVPLPGPPQPPVQPPPRPVQTSWWSRIPFWVLLISAIAGVVALAAAGFAILRRKKLSPSSPTPDDGSQAGSGSTDATFQETPPPESGSEDGMPVKLTVVMGKNAGSAHELRLLKKAVIGRADDCAVVVPDPKVSGHHCELALVHGQVLVYDLASTNSTYVNGVPVRGRHKLEPQDTILVGSTELRVQFEER
jgi:VWFA-related protein